MKKSDSIREYIKLNGQTPYSTIARIFGERSLDKHLLEADLDQLRLPSQQDSNRLVLMVVPGTLAQEIRAAEEERIYAILAEKWTKQTVEELIHEVGETIRRAYASGQLRRFDALISGGYAFKGELAKLQALAEPKAPTPE